MLRLVDLQPLAERAKEWARDNDCQLWGFHMEGTDQICDLHNHLWEKGRRLCNGMHTDEAGGWEPYLILLELAERADE